MEMVKVVGLFILGLVLICVGGDKLVDAGVAIARKLGIPQIVVGATIVSLGTTLPEVLVSTTAALQGSVEITAGNSLGSIICNTTLIAGLAQLIRPTAKVETKPLKWRAACFFGVMIIVNIVAAVMGKLTLIPGICLILGFIVYAYLNVKFPGEEDEEEEKPEGNLVMPFIMLAISAVALYFGAKFLVDNGVIIAEALGVPERIIAVTFIALGTSLPELMTSIASLVKGYGNVGIGNILGANLLDLLLVLGIPAAIRGYGVARETWMIDMPLGLAVMALLFVPILIKKRGYRWQGALLVLIYVGYCAFSFIK